MGRRGDRPCFFSTWIWLKALWERFSTAIKIDPPQADSKFDLPEADLLAAGEFDVP
jgi:hypothetical protein